MRRVVTFPAAIAMIALAACTGPQGPSGPAGEAGPAGPVGPAGPQGAQGLCSLPCRSPAQASPGFWITLFWVCSFLRSVWPPVSK
jgi:hypothetical protein